MYERYFTWVRAAGSADGPAGIAWRRGDRTDCWFASWTERQHYHGSSDPDHIWHGAMRSHLSADRNLLCIRVRRLCTVYSVKDSGNCIRYCNSL